MSFDLGEAPVRYGEVPLQDSGWDIDTYAIAGEVIVTTGSVLTDRAERFEVRASVGRTGEPLWTGRLRADDVPVGPPAVDVEAGVVYQVTKVGGADADFRVLELDVVTGALTGSWPLPAAAHPAATFPQDSLSTVRVVEGFLITAGVDGAAATDVNSGNVLWSSDGRFARISGNTVIVDVSPDIYDVVLVALDVRTGEQVWTIDTLGGSIGRDVSITDHYVFDSYEDLDGGTTVVYDAATGQPVVTLPRAYDSCAGSAETAICLTSDSGWQVVRLNLPTGATVWQTAVDSAVYITGVNGRYVYVYPLGAQGVVLDLASGVPTSDAGGATNLNAFGNGYAIRIGDGGEGMWSMNNGRSVGGYGINIYPADP